MKKSVEQRMDTAQQLCQHGDLHAAKKIYVEILSDDPDNVACLHNLGLIYAQLQDGDQALHYLHQALRLAQDDPHIHNSLANVYLAQKQFPQATQHFEAALRYDPSYAEAHNNYANLLARQKKYLPALKHYQQALLQRPDYLDAHYNLGLLFFRNAKIDEAIIQFKNVTRLHPNHMAAHHQLGNLYLQKNKLDAAKTHYLRVLSIDPEHINTLNNLGVIALKQSHPQQAINYFTQVLALDENHMDARSNIAATFMQHDRYENALRHYRIILEKQPQHLEAHYNTGVAFMCVGDLEHAQQHFEAVLVQEPQHIDALCNLAAIAMRVQNYAAAETYYRKAAVYQPQNPLVQYMLSCLGGKNTPTQAPPQYIENLFDNYAFFFEQHLKDVLHYQAPQLLHDALRAVTALPEKSGVILDLGCGTGLSAQPFIPYAKKIIGVDLSARMLSEAEKKQIYDQLIKKDMLTFLKTTRAQVDLIIAADAFCYCGDLTDILKQAWRVLNPGGYCAFTVERAKTGDYSLQKTARYAHSKNYLHRLFQQSPWHLTRFEKISSRKQENKAVPGYLVILYKPQLKNS